MNGRWYYLNADGDMVIGWILVNGGWYYLNPMAGVLDPGGNPIPEGAMYVSAVTPDGYHVGVSGAADIENDICRCFYVLYLS